jgi:uncharacterized protein YuzE
MKITYDPEGDVLYIQLRCVTPADAVDVEEGVTVELDETGHITAIEILDASDRLTPEELTSVSYENLLFAAAEVPRATAAAQ